MAEHRHLSGRILAGLALLAVFWVTLAPPFDYDLWFDIRMGEEIVRTRGIPHHTSFLGTQDQFGSHYSANDEWGFCLAVYLLYQVGGMAGLSLGMSTLLTVLFGILGASCRQVGLPTWATVLWLGLGYQLMRSRFMLRPQLVTDILLASLIYLLLRAERGQTRGWPWLALPLFLFWCNVHAGFMAGLVVLAGWAVLEIPRPRVPPRLPLQAVALAALAPLLTPGSWHLYGYLYQHFLVRTLDMDVVLEWQPLSPGWWTGPMGVYAIVALAGFGLAWREGRLRLPHLGLVGLLFVAAVRHNRAAGELVAITMPLVAAAWSSRVPDRAALNALVSLGLGGLLAWHGVPKIGEAPARTYPVGALPYLREVQGTILNAYHFGGWLTFQHLRPFIHGLTPTYPPQLMADYLAVIGDPQKSPELLRRYPVQAILMHYPPFEDIHTAFLERLANDPAWSLVYWDDVSLLFLPSPQPRAWKALMPALPQPFRGSLPEAEREIERKLQEDPTCITAWKLKAEAQSRQGRRADAERTYSEMTRRFPDDGRGWLGLGATLFEAGRPLEAEGALRQAIRLEPRSATARYNLALLLTQRVQQEARAGRSDQARGLLREARSQAAEALRLQPGLPAAANLLRQLDSASGS